MKKMDVSRRKFLGQTGSLAAGLPLAAALPAAVEVASPAKVQAATSMSSQAQIPMRNLPVRQRGATVVNASDYGLPTDGVSDCSQAINAAINALPVDGGTVKIPYHNTSGKYCVYKIDTSANSILAGSRVHHFGIQLRSNMLLQLYPGVQLVAMPNNLDRAYVIFAQGLNDVEIADGAIIGERYGHTPSGKGTDEWGMGLELLSTTAITVRDMNISDCNGDGICVGGVTDLVVSNVICTGNRRQAMSLTSVSGAQVYDSEFSYTYGTAPQDGIDIEPDGTGVAENIVIDNCLFRGNTAAGLGLNGMHGATIRNLTVTNCTMCFNGSSGFYSYQSSQGIVDGGTLYGNAIYQNKYVGLYLDHNTTNYTVGGDSEDDPRNNSFANNLASRGLIYPTPNKRSQQGAAGVSTDIGLSTAARQPEANDVINWNNFYSQ